MGNVLLAAIILLVVIGFPLLIYAAATRRKPEGKFEMSPIDPPGAFESPAPSRFTDEPDDSGGSFLFDIVGESRYQRTIESLAGGRKEGGASKVLPAEIVPEEDNPYDVSAVAVAVEGRKVGYLSRENARKYRQLHGKDSSRCRAKIVGGWDRDGDRGFFGVKLDFSFGRNG